MLISLLNQQLEQMRCSLVKRELWPISEQEGYDLRDPEVRAEAWALKKLCWPVVISTDWEEENGRRSATWDDKSLESLHAYLDLTSEFTLAAGLARPERIWLVRIEGGHVDRSLGALRKCTPLQYLELEEIISQLERMGH